MSAGDRRVIVVAGEALVDLMHRGPDQLLVHSGGGPYNVARTIGRLEQPACYLGRISSDRFGARLRSDLEADGVWLDTVVATDDPTTLALAEVDGDGSATYHFYADGTSAPGLTVEDATRVLPKRVGMLHLGTLGLVLEPMASTLEALIDAAEEDTLVAIDPNCRPWAIDDPTAYRRRLSRMLVRCDVLKASEDDLAWLEPGRNPVDAARTLLAHGPPLVLVTRGPSGAVVVTADEVIPVAAPRPAKVVDTIGAGDAFGGAFLAWWLHEGLGRADLDRRDAVLAATEFACLVATRTCERPGAMPPRAAELGLMSRHPPR